MNYRDNQNEQGVARSTDQPKKPTFPHQPRFKHCYKVPNAAVLEEYKKAFTFFDANKDGYITIDELERTMNECDVYPTKLELRVLMSQGDLDNKFYYFTATQNGVITFDEFVHLMSVQDTLPTKYTQEQLLECFLLFDQDGDGFIELNEMVDVVSELQLGRFFPNSIIEQLFKTADVDGDGKISFQEFTTAMNS